MLHVIRSLGLFLFVTSLVAPAWAGEAKVWNGLVTFVAGPGETNNVTILFTVQGFRVRDSGAPLAIGPGCTRIDANTANCPAGSISGLYATLSDRDDRLVNSTYHAINAQGGPGNDYLMGGYGNDTLIGEDGLDDLYGRDGDDILTGGAYDDYLDGGPGNDYMAGEAHNDKLIGGPDDDIIDGGVNEWYSPEFHALYGRFDPKFDVLTYESVAGPVSVRLYLTTQQDTISAGKDTIRNVEQLEGTAHGDTLAGKDGSYFLRGNDGDDTLYAFGQAIAGEFDGSATAWGGRGNDTFDVVGTTTRSLSLDGGPGNDTLLGGDGGDSITGGGDGDYIEGRGGNDRIYAADGVRDLIHCGPEFADHAWFDVPLDTVSSTCEVRNP